MRKFKQHSTLESQLQRLTVIVCCMLVSANTNAQSCLVRVTPQTVSIKNFDFSVPGQALDRLSGRKWDRCVYGQNWNEANSTCTGNPVKISWEVAMLIAEENNKRLPDIKELNSILDLQCIIPPTHLKIFPNTPGSTKNGLWSSTPYLSPNANITNAWYIDLGFGITNFREVNKTNFVRYINK